MEGDLPEEQKQQETGAANYGPRPISSLLHDAPGVPDTESCMPPKVAPAKITAVFAAHDKHDKREVAILEGRTSKQWWPVCLKRGAFSVGEKVLFVTAGLMIRDDPRIKTAARTPYKRKTIFTKGGVRNAYILFKTPVRPFPDNPGSIISLEPFTEFKDVPLGTDVSGLIGVTDDATLRREEEQRKEAKAIHKAESAAMHKDAVARRAQRLAASRLRNMMKEAVDRSRTCFFGGDAPDYVHVTSLAHLEEHPEYFEEYRDTLFDVTEKEDGLNMTLYCSRLQDPRRPAHICIGRREVRWSSSNYYWRLVHSLGVVQKVVDSGRNLVLEGVVVGPSFRRGYEDGYRRDFFRVFEIFDLDENRSMHSGERHMFCRENEIPVVKDLLSGSRLFADFGTLSDLVEFASQKTQRGTPRHGIVVRSLDPAKPLWFDVSNPSRACERRS